jgi:signal transduction histidine kinase
MYRRIPAPLVDVAAAPIPLLAGLVGPARSLNHELKTALTAIRGYAEGLEDGVFSADEAAAPILVETRRLERLVRDLLDLDRFGRDEVVLDIRPTDLTAVARAAVARHQATARRFGITLAWAGERRPVAADPDRALQIASNLVENALRATPVRGSVIVRAEAGALRVSHTGPPLAPDDLPRAFECFFLYDSQRRDRPVGSGVGLALVKELALAMGGAVSVVSEAGRRTEFVVNLPAATTSTRSR